MTAGTLQALAEDHLPLVSSMVRRFPSAAREQEELYQRGCVGLMKALARFDPSGGSAFTPYAAAMILQEMRALCRMDAPLRTPRADRELRLRIRKVLRRLNAHLHREPTLPELACALRAEPAELALRMEHLPPQEERRILALRLRLRSGPSHAE